MSEAKLEIQCGRPDAQGKRFIAAILGSQSFRDRIDVDDSFKRGKFREQVIDRFSLGEDAHQWLEERIIEAADSEDEKAEPRRAASLVRLCDVQAEAIEWLWPNRIALGKLTLIVGDPGVSKSFTLLDIATRVTRGTKWPDADSCAPLGEVILLTAEDDIADTIRPRLDAAGADVSKILALQAVKGVDETGEYERGFDLARDLEILENALDQVPDCRLIGIDPISAYLGKTDSHNNSEVRALLKPLGDLAAKRRIAIVAISHLRKSDGAMAHRTMGSLAFSAAARAVWCIAKDSRDPKKSRRLMMPVKNNVGQDGTGLAFTLSARYGEGTPCVVWEAEPVEGNADDVMNQKQRPGPDPDELEEALGFLRSALANGPRTTRDVDEEARQVHGIAKRTLERARGQLGVVAFRDKVPGPWMVKLPTPPTTPPQDPWHGDLGGLGGLGENPQKNEKLAYARDNTAKTASVGSDMAPLPEVEEFMRS